MIKNKIEIICLWWAWYTTQKYDYKIWFVIEDVLNFILQINCNNEY